MIPDQVPRHAEADVRPSFMIEDVGSFVDCLPQLPGKMPILQKLLPILFGPPDYVDPLFGPQIPSIWWKSYGVHLFLQFLMFGLIAYAGVFFIWMMCNIRR